MTYSYNPQTGQITDNEDGQLIATMSESATPEQAKLLASAPTLEATLDQWSDEAAHWSTAEAKTMRMLEAATEELHRVSAINAELVKALEAIEPFTPSSSAKEGGAVRYSANVQAADKVREALEKAKQ